MGKGKEALDLFREVCAERAAPGAFSAASREGAGAAGSKRGGMESGGMGNTETGSSGLESVAAPGRFPFPYTPYRIQEQFMQALYCALDAGRVGIFESPTGTVRRRGRARRYGRC